MTRAMPITEPWIDERSSVGNDSLGPDLHDRLEGEGAPDGVEEAQGDPREQREAEDDRDEIGPGQEHRADGVEGHPQRGVDDLHERHRAEHAHAEHHDAQQGLLLHGDPHDVHPDIGAELAAGVGPDVGEHVEADQGQERHQEDLLPEHVLEPCVRRPDRRRPGRALAIGVGPRRRFRDAQARDEDDQRDDADVGKHDLSAELAHAAGDDAEDVGADDPAEPEDLREADQPAAVVVRCRLGDRGEGDGQVGAGSEAHEDNARHEHGEPGSQHEQDRPHDDHHHRGQEHPTPAVAIFQTATGERADGDAQGQRGGQDADLSRGDPDGVLVEHQGGAGADDGRGVDVRGHPADQRHPPGIGCSGFGSVWSHAVLLRTWAARCHAVTL